VCGFKTEKKDAAFEGAKKFYAPENYSKEMIVKTIKQIQQKANFLLPPEEKIEVNGTFSRKMFNAVKKVQKELKKVGYDINVNGKWDEKTDEAFNDYYKKTALKAPKLKTPKPKSPIVMVPKKKKYETKVKVSYKTKENTKKYTAVVTITSDKEWKSISASEKNTLVEKALQKKLGANYAKIDTETIKF